MFLFKAWIFMWYIRTSLAKFLVTLGLNISGTTLGKHQDWTWQSMRILMEPIHQVFGEKHAVEVTWNFQNHRAEIDWKGDACFSMLMLQVLNVVGEIWWSIGIEADIIYCDRISIEWNDVGMASIIHAPKTGQLNSRLLLWTWQAGPTAPMVPQLIGTKRFVLKNGVLYGPKKGVPTTIDIKGPVFIRQNMPKPDSWWSNRS